MIKCPACENENQETIHQHDASLAGYMEYGTNFTCLQCRKPFTVENNEEYSEKIIKFPGV